MENKIELKPIKDLVNKKYYISSYQRGYRWDSRQVEDLLKDIEEFAQKKRTPGEFYCLQPIVVKQKIKKDDENKLRASIQELDTDFINEAHRLLDKYVYWEVIDGQQRLTTIKIILSFLNFENKIDISYETRADGTQFLNNIASSEEPKNIDFYHIFEAYKTIEKWFNNKNDRDSFKEILLNNVQVIWYETTEKEEPIKVFTRLNIGKIPLTNAELIKALFINKSNFTGDYNGIILQQQEIASQWDSIEYQLQNDEFWLFLNEQDEIHNKRLPTRIDLIFDLICEKNLLELKLESNELGNDSYMTYRYFDKYFKTPNKNQEKLTHAWSVVKQLQMTFNEWYNDIELYHYVGYLIICKMKITDIYNFSKGKMKFEFINVLKDEIIKVIGLNSIDKLRYPSDSKETGCVYDLDKIRKVLLLFNIETTIKQCNRQKTSKYLLPVFYKFPFHLYKREDWDVEHIASQSGNELNNKSAQDEWLLASYLSQIISNDLKERIISFVVNKDAKGFETLNEEIFKMLPSKNPIKEKNGIGNLALLDSKTNRGYKNSIFPTKRQWIIGKDQGIKIIICVENNIITTEEKDDLIAFIPVCTKNVFLKYYSPMVSDLLEWNQDDAEGYRDNIQKMLNYFIK